VQDVKQTQAELHQASAESGFRTAQSKSSSMLLLPLDRLNDIRSQLVDFANLLAEAAKVPFR